MSTEKEHLFIAFIECKREGRWQPISKEPPRNQYEVWATYQAMKEPDCVIKIVAPDGLTRTFQIKNGSMISIGNNMLRMDSDAVVDEISVDEDVQMGRKEKPRSTLR